MIERKDRNKSDTWDLSALAEDRNDYRRKIRELEKRLSDLTKYRGRLGESSSSFHEALKTYFSFMLDAETALHWAWLNYYADSADALTAEDAGLADVLGAKIAEAVSWMEPELMKMDGETLHLYLSEERNADYRIYVEKARRMKEHVLSDREERILSLFDANSGGYQAAFNDANNIDLDFGEINGEKLTHSSFIRFIRNSDENIRKEAYEKLYGEYERHEHVLARIFEGSIKNDIFLSRSRGYDSSLSAALFPDRVDRNVYTGLIESVHSAFPLLHRYYRIRAEIMGKEKLRHYDVYTPLTEPAKSRHTYDEAVSLIEKAVQPLGKEYTSVLVNGLTEGRWVDRYENRGKRSGAFSSGGYVGNPYILINYEEDVLDSVFTLIHEGGHSMHSYYSARNNPFPSYNYTIFEAEVASTFNENLLSAYLIKNAASEQEEMYLVAKKTDDIVATFFRQTMFAEYELLLHEAAENGKPLTVDYMRETYRRLLEAYFGPVLEFEEVSDLEGLRIPHFYNAFYVYKYATGIAASNALSKRVLNGGEKEREEYLSFLKSGGSCYPMEALEKAGVNMRDGSAIDATALLFGELLDRLEFLRKRKSADGKC